MKKLLLIALTLFAFPSVGSERAQEAWKLINEGAMVVDVRTPEEFNQKHLPNAVNIPLKTLPDSLGSLPKDSWIVVYCRSGNRSGQALEFMEEQGFSQVHNGGGLRELLASE
ncbi:rhodanese-like domain-containing protein [Vibrio albus]|uniref:Rhodanese-like domain-containing protein n=1 Tax=Vibrio albus TaxID=2200953 RepID=A0A2U3BD92_9VIBR|nr:rhodanese-like domain-containing protein [Vibrio albus]PWI34743.1 rhodanese-like domain-containing protein [Vibrio albus]